MLSNYKLDSVASFSKTVNFRFKDAAMYKARAHQIIFFRVCKNEISIVDIVFSLRNSLFSIWFTKDGMSQDIGIAHAKQLNKL